MGSATVSHTCSRCWAGAAGSACWPVPWPRKYTSSTASCSCAWVMAAPSAASAVAAVGFSSSPGCDWPTTSTGAHSPGPSTSRSLSRINSRCPIGNCCTSRGPAPGGRNDNCPNAGPRDVQQLPRGQRLLIRLRDLLVDGPGECAPVEVVGQSQPGLLLNPTAATADAALGAAMAQAHEQEAVLLVY